jgi:MFS transporter, PAT family, beta-lactamase induction signal transducer AmpG
MDQSTPSPYRAWSWIPTLYFSQGIPYVVVMTLSGVMYKNFNLSNTDNAFYTSWLYLPWVIKPLWAPLVDLCRTKRWWITTLQLFIGAAMGAVALTVPAPFFFQATLALFWLIAFSSATHDIAADGFYLLALPSHHQSAFVGVRSTFFRLAMIAGQGGLIYMAGALQVRTGDTAQAWSWVFGLLAAGFVVVGIYHLLVLPRPVSDVASAAVNNRSPWAGWWTVFSAFFRKPHIASILGFLLLYRLGEAQLLKLVAPFLLDGREVGGLGLTNQQLGVYYGTYGVLALVIGGLLGGYLVSKFGLRKLIWPMAAAINVPNAIYIILAIMQPQDPWAIGAALVAEQLGYGFGFTAYMVFMMMVAEGEHKTAHYALCTGFMALGMMLPGFKAGWIQELVGYPSFFVWVCICALPSLAAVVWVKIAPDVGRRRTSS